MKNLKTKIENKLQELKEVDFLDLFYTSILKTKMHEKIDNMQKLEYFIDRMDSFKDNAQKTYSNLEKFKQSLENKPIKSDAVIDVISKIDNYFLYINLNNTLENKKIEKKKNKL